MRKTAFVERREQVILSTCNHIKASAANIASSRYCINVQFIYYAYVGRCYFRAHKNRLHDAFFVPTINPCELNLTQPRMRQTKKSTAYHCHWLNPLKWTWRK